MNFTRIICLTLLLSFIGFTAPSYADGPANPTNTVDPWDREYWNEDFKKYEARKKQRQANLANMKDPSYRFPSLTSLDAKDANLSHSDLDVWLSRLFSATNGYIENLNASLDETAAAAKSCDRAKYDAAKDRLITNYTKAALYLRRQMDNIDAMAQASGELEENYNHYRDAKRGWSMFWVAVHDKFANGEKMSDHIREIWEKDRKSSRYMSLGQAYNQAYGDMLHRMEEVIRTADYPPFVDCGKPAKDPAVRAAEAKRAEAEAMASQKAMDEMGPDLAEQDSIFEKVGKIVDQAVSEVDLPSSVTTEGTVGELPIIPDPKQNADGSFQTPDFGNLIVTPDVVLDVPDTSGMEEMLKETVENMKDTPLGKHQANPCGYDPKKVCKILLKEFRKDCTKELKAFYKICKAGPSIKDCKKRCQANWQQGVHQQALADLAKKHILVVNGTFEKDFEDDYLAKEAEIKENKERIKQMEDEARERIIHIYINTNTDMIIRHNGNKFDPKPPLRYGGTEDGGLRIYERNEIQYMKARNEQLRQEIEEIANSGTDWLPMALDKWSSGDGICHAPQKNDANREACIAECNGKPLAGVTHACYSSLVPQLVMPYGRAYLYPPEHPERDPTKGLK